MPDCGVGDSGAGTLVDVTTEEEQQDKSSTLFTFAQQLRQFCQNMGGMQAQIPDELPMLFRSSKRCKILRLEYSPYLD